VKNVADSMKSREEEFSVRDAILNEQWRKEDDRQHLLREQRTRQLKVFEEEARMSALQEDLALRMQRLQMERDARVGSCVLLLFALSLARLPINRHRV
jgi:hypothetical protein